MDRLEAPPSYIIDESKLEELIKERNQILINYDGHGFREFEKVFKKHKKEWQSANINSFYNILVKEFPTILKAMFFSFYFICQKASSITENKLFQSGSPSQLFYGIFADLVNFKATDNIDTFSILMIGNEVFIFDFLDFGENIEFCFFVPFLWYRAFDPDSTGFDYFDCGILP